MKAALKPLMTSNIQTYGTPRYLKEAFNRLFHIDADGADKMGITVLTKDKLNRVIKTQHFPCDSLDVNWKYYGNVFYINPPYERDTLRKFLLKAKSEASNGVVSVCLIPARTGNNNWAEIISPHATMIIFMTGRIKFNGQLDKKGNLIPEDKEVGAPFDSALVIFGTNPRMEKVLKVKGRISWWNWKKSVKNMGCTEKL